MDKDNKIKQLEDEITRLKKIITVMQKQFQQLNNKVTATNESVRKAHTDIKTLRTRR